MNNQNERILEIENLTVTFKIDDVVVEAVNDVSLSLEKGKTLGIVGETGAGKTTTALSIMNLIPDPPGIIERGCIKLNGKEILGLSQNEMTKIRGNEVSMIFQDPMSSLNPVFTVGEQIAEGIMIHQNLSHADALVRAGEMLEMVGIPSARLNDYPHQFSGGMKQRVVIAIALACNPQLLIADEPTTALDVTIQAQVLELMKELKQKYEMAMIMITHDLGLVAEVCDTVAVMYAGKIIEQGTLEHIFNETKHPYTEGLFNSLPNINNRKAELIPIPGLMPDPANLPKGCVFAPRCSYATEKCTQQEPTLFDYDGHMVRCTAYEDPNFRIERSVKRNG